MKVDIEKKDQTFTFEVDEGEQILYAGLRAGIPLPYECATGTCGTCKARIKEGDIDDGWDQAPGKKNLNPDRREFLMCQTRAGCDLKLGVPSAIRKFREDDLLPSHLTGIATNWQALTHDVMQFDVSLPESTRFHAGQFFTIKTPGLEGYRAYSMVNYEPQTDQLRFIIKNKVGGGFSDWAFDQSRGEDPLELFGPIGRATFHPDEDHNLFMIAGGSGIAGLMSILTHGHQIGYFKDHRADVYFGVRTLEDAFFIDELSEIQRNHQDTVNITVVFSEENGAADTSWKLGELHPGFGMVHEAALQGIEPGTPNTMAYIAGPPPMVDACIRPLILDLKFGANMIRYDKFG